MQNLTQPSRQPSGFATQQQQHYRHQSTKVFHINSLLSIRKFIFAEPGFIVQIIVLSEVRPSRLRPEDTPLSPSYLATFYNGIFLETQSIDNLSGAAMPRTTHYLEFDQPQHPITMLYTILASPAGTMRRFARLSQEYLAPIILRLIEEHDTENGPQPASEAAISRLPRKVMDQSMIDKTNNTVECSICLERVEIGTEIATLPCTHRFHSQCIESWLKEHDSCPCCRNGIMSTNADKDKGQCSGTHEQPSHIQESPSMDRRRQPSRGQKDREPRSTSCRSSKTRSGGLFDYVRNLFAAKQYNSS